MKLKPEHASLLREDLEHKKVYIARFDTRCDICSKDLFRGDDLYFMGSKRRVCSGCIAVMIKDLGGQR